MDWQAMIANLAVVALLISVWTHAQGWLETRPRQVRNLIFGVLMGVGAVASMLLSVEDAGVRHDLRSPLVALAGLFGGPLGATAAVVLSGAGRIAAGGQVAVGLFGIAVIGALGVLAHAVIRGRDPSVPQVVQFAVAVGIVGLSSMLLLPLDLAKQMFFSYGLPLAIASVAATAVFGLVILKARRQGQERDLLRNALVHSPDYLFIQNAEGRFVRVSQLVAYITNHLRAADLVGKTYADIAPPEVAGALTARSQEVMRTGVPLHDVEESHVMADGTELWLSTSLVPLSNIDGEVIGVGGVSRNITLQKQLGRELEESRNLFSNAVAEMSDGLAIFDKDGYLVFCNQRYAQLAPLTSDVRKPGAHIRDILAAVAMTSEERGIPANDPGGWVDRTAATLHQQSDQEIQLYDGRWLQLRSRPTSDGKALIAVSDVTTLKESEAALRTLSEQLRQLAATDGLTGIMNRRALDAALGKEIARAKLKGTPLSLLITDVDHFKAYNDCYGHLAGDECLKAVSACFKGVRVRPGDFVARYGGEEFVAVLPDTDEAGAVAIGERFRQALIELGLPHERTECGVVTASIGVATLTAGGEGAAELLAHADAALYRAKSEGRNRVAVWHPAPGTPRLEAPVPDIVISSSR